MSEAITDRSALSDVERRVVDEISTDEPWALLEEFSELERLSGTEDERRAAEYLTGRLDAFDIDHERYDPELYVSQPHDASIRAVNKTFEPGIVKTVGFSASTKVQAEVEYVGTVSSDLVDDGEEGGRDPFAELEDLEGRIALVDGGSFSIGATTVLEEKGASGVIAIHEHRREPHDGIATPVWGGAPPYDEKDRIPDVPIVNVTKHDGEILREWTESDSCL